MSQDDSVQDPQLERQARQFLKPSGPLLLAAMSLALVGVALIVFGRSGVRAVGIVLAVLAGIPAVVGATLAVVAAISRWAARDRPFA